MKKIDVLCRENGIEFYGIANTEKGSALVCLFPYYRNFEKGNISRYAAVFDYHKVCRTLLGRIAEQLSAECEVYADISPYNDIDLARRAGLGIIGKNGLLINEKYGSYVFIGYIVMCGVFIKETGAKEGKCFECGRCIEQCPAEARNEKGFCKNKCLSYITQKKGELTPAEILLMKKYNTVWGCDICSQVCPHNENIPETPIKEFYEFLIPSLKTEDIEGLSQKQFKQKYENCAFVWRGKNVLLRNLKAVENKEQP